MLLATTAANKKVFLKRKCPAALQRHDIQIGCSVFFYAPLHKISLTSTEGMNSPLSENMPLFGLLVMECCDSTEISNMCYTQYYLTL